MLRLAMLIAIVSLALGFGLPNHSFAKRTGHKAEKHHHSKEGNRGQNRSCEGNSGQGVGASCFGNQGNDKKKGHAAGNEEPPGDGDNGGDGDGNSDDDNAEEPNDDGEKDVKVNRERKRKLRVELEPIFHFDLDFGSYLVDLTPQKTEGSLLLSNVSIGDGGEGYMLTDYYTVEAGLGVKANAFFNNATGLANHFFATLGVMPIIGKKLTSVQWVQNRKKSTIKEILTRKPPMKAQSIDSWTVGDSVVFESTGGILFFGNIGLYLLNIGLNHTDIETAEGTWRTFVEKRADKLVYVKISKHKLTDYMIFLGAGFTSAGVANFEGKDKSFSFLFDLSTQPGVDAYEDLMRGNIANSQALAANSDAPSVTRLTKSVSNMDGTGFRWFFGIPFVSNYSWSNDEVQSWTHKENYVSGINVDATYGIFRKYHTSRVFISHESHIETFYGAAYKETSAQKNTSKGYFAKYINKYRDDSTNVAEFRGFLKKLIYTTGLKRLFSFDISDEDIKKLPKTNNQGSLLNYISMGLEVTFTEENINSIASIPSTMKSEEVSAVLNEILTVYFSKPGVGHNSLCAIKGIYIKQINQGSKNGPSQNSLKEWKRCKEEVTEESKESIIAMYNAAEKITESLTASPEELSMAIGEFGKQMITNQFTFRIGVVMAGEGVLLDFNLEGEFVSKYSVSLVTAIVERQLVWMKAKDVSSSIPQSLSDPLLRNIDYGASLATGLKSRPLFCVLQLVIIGQTHFGHQRRATFYIHFFFE